VILLSRLLSLLNSSSICTDNKFYYIWNTNYF